MRADVLKATEYQFMASNPQATRLASANAGSGKTKVLVDRVSRILLEGTDPDKILCLTYTKAAATEMQTRLFQKLGEWSVMSEAQLNAALNKLLMENKTRDAVELRKARQLFAKALETPEGLKVQTIHAFCERVLGRFPIEAGIEPGFEPIDDADMRDMRAEIEADLFRQAWGNPDSDLAWAIRTLAADKADQTLESLMGWMAGSVETIRHWADDNGPEKLADYLGLSMSDTARSVKERAWEISDKAQIRSCGESLLGGSKTDAKKAEVILQALNIEDAEAAFDLYASCILTLDGNIRASVVTKQAPPDAQDFWGIKGVLTPEAERIHKAAQDALAAKCLEMTRAVYILAQDYADSYEAAKRVRRGLDFNDQIILVRDLLTRRSVSDWVRYKLDGGVDHILVDEAQDTSPSQWVIIDALRDAFNPPDPKAPIKGVKTFFAVGDEKQSIYSFQGARPEQFLARRQSYLDSETALAIQMSMSFRSAPQVLASVDAVFESQGKLFNPEEAVAGDPVIHKAFREDAGIVELWPISPRPEDPPEEKAWDTTPVDAPGRTSAREKLAAVIAECVKNWIDKGEPVYDRERKKTRPMNAGDVLILVRRRNDFFDAIIRHLKMKDVAVAGADRLVISDALVVKDLLSLTRFVLLPSDNLSLAEVLRSPIINLSEDDLFHVAAKRGGQTLWQALQERNGQAASILKEIIQYSRRFAPYEFYQRVLDMITKDGQSRLKQIYTRLGLEAEDALEAFLSRALAHQRRGAPSLQHFLAVMTADKQDIKREMDNAQGEVRVMTVHGAKGLEAPVVFLPDTTQLPTQKSDSGLFAFQSGMVYLPSSKKTPEALMSLRDAKKARDQEEYMRLLYVAMTRAESRLIVCGFQSGKSDKIAEGCWYDEVSRGFEKLETKPHETGFGDGLIYGYDPEPCEVEIKPTAKADIFLPDWAAKAAKAEGAQNRRVTPSHLLAGDDKYDVPVRSPLSQSVDRFRRGNLTHKLLEILPDIAADRREAAAAAYLDSHVDLSVDLKADIAREVMAVLNHPDYAPFFAEGSRAEVSLGGQGLGLPKDMRLNAQIDRLAVTDDAVYIIDYKSNRPPPLETKDVPDIYWGQMAAYREMTKLIYPGRGIICALLWTDGPRLMILPDEGLDAALTRIGGLPT